MSGAHPERSKESGGHGDTAPTTIRHVSAILEQRADSAPSVAGLSIPETPDLARLRRERVSRLHHHMAMHGVDALLVLGTANVHYATGAAMPAVDAGRASLLRPVALVLADDPVAHLFTPYPCGASGRIPDDHVHPALLVDLDEAVPDITRTLGALADGAGRLAVDEVTQPLLQALGKRPVSSAQPIIGGARGIKTVDEIACIRAAQRINEAAMSRVYEMLRPGARQSDLTAVFVQHCFELGATGMGVDTIWQVMEPTRALGPWTTHGDIGYPTATTDRIVRDGDVIWVDSGILYEGYASDFGRTWIVGAQPTARQQKQFERWRSVMEATLEALHPGVAGIDLCRAAVEANNGERPWLHHFYLAHGVGVGSAEMPLIGTDLGDQFDASLTLDPGTVLVLEPMIWDEGAAGHRAEEVYAVTDDGWTALSNHTYAPFEEQA